MAESDRPEFIRVHEVSGDHFWRWFPSRPPGFTIAGRFEQSYSRGRTGEPAGTDFPRVAVTADGRIAGFFNLSQIFRGPFQNAYAGWAVSLDAVGKGLATEGVNALLDAAFSPAPLGLGLHRVQANVVPTNTASTRVAEKCGFRREGLAIRYLEINGTWQDHAMFAKLADEHTPTAQLFES